MRGRVILLVAGLAFAAGCGKSPGETAESPPPTPAIPVIVPQPVAEVKVPVAPAPEPFRFPSDAGGRAVASALEPGLPSAPVLHVSAAPKPRTSDLDRGEMPLPKVNAVMPRGPLPKAKLPRPSPPPEGVPADLGQGAVADPTAVRLPEKPLLRAPAPPAPTASDVPPLARQVPDRASLDDPTADIASARSVFTTMPLPFTPSWFVRLTIPDPFELAVHLRGKTGASGELGTRPVNGPPARP